MILRRGPLALLALLLATALITGCGSSDDKSSGGGGGGGGQDATALLEKAFSTNVDSGQLKVVLSANLKGSSQLSGPLKATISGPFRSRGKKEVPLVDLSVDASGGGQSLSGKVITTADNAFLGFRGQTYEVGKDVYKKFLDQAKANQSSRPASLAEFGIKPENWLKDPKVSSGPSVGGDTTKKVSGQLDADRMVRDLVGVTKSSAFKKQLKGRPAPSVSDSEIKKVVDALVNPSFEVDVDAQNRLRRASFTTGFKASEGTSGGPKSGTVAFLVELPEVGTKPEIKAPTDAKPLQLLLQQFGLGGGGALNGLKTN